MGGETWGARDGGVEEEEEEVGVTVGEGEEDLIEELNREEESGGEVGREGGLDREGAASMRPNAFSSSVLASSRVTSCQSLRVLLLLMEEDEG
jgi:hypothetical protein